MFPPLGGCVDRAGINHNLTRLKANGQKTSAKGSIKQQEDNEAILPLVYIYRCESDGRRSLGQLEGHVRSPLLLGTEEPGVPYFYLRKQGHIRSTPCGSEMMHTVLSLDAVAKTSPSCAHAQSQMIRACDLSAATGTKPARHYS